MKQYIITLAQMQQIFDYLQNQPYKQVFQLVQMLHNLEEVTTIEENDNNEHI